jgi:hypothetical protein
MQHTDSKRDKRVDIQSRQILEHLEELATRLGVEIVYQRLEEEDFSVKGGLCKINGSFKVFIDRSKPIDEQIKILARGLSTFNIEEVYLFPYVREIIHKARNYC